MGIGAVIVLNGQAVRQADGSRPGHSTLHHGKEPVIVQGQLPGGLCQIESFVRDDGKVNLGIGGGKIGFVYAAEPLQRVVDRGFAQGIFLCRSIALGDINAAFVALPQDETVK